MSQRIFLSLCILWTLLASDNKVNEGGQNVRHELKHLAYCHSVHRNTQ